MNFILLLYFLLIILGARKYPKNQPFAKNCFSKEQCLSLRGAFAVLVVLHHAGNEINGTMLFSQLYHFGVWATAGFFVISGYGLTVSLQNKKEKYLGEFVSKRLRSPVFPYFVMILLYSAYFRIRDNYTLKDVLNTFLIGAPIVKNSWYIIAIMYLYALYYIFAKLLFLKGKVRSFILVNFVGAAVYIMLCRGVGFGTWWYNTVFCFVVGIIFAEYEKDIIKKVKKHIVPVNILTAVLLAVIFVCKIKLPRGTDLFLGATVLFAVTFAVFVPLLCMIVDFSKNAVFKWIGKISLELYLIHGLVIEFLKTCDSVYSNGAVFVCLTVVLSIISAWIIHFVLSKLWFVKNSPHHDNIK
ncbi:MAG: acyltransferase [Clostridia bacterium]|nr:acyltransferase [Clostridia bacterium]